MSVGPKDLKDTRSVHNCVRVYIRMLLDKSGLKGLMYRFSIVAMVSNLLLAGTAATKAEKRRSQMLANQEMARGRVTDLCELHSPLDPH